jgi:pimeloyl-ACP methyl ester carboxylesterase
MKDKIPEAIVAAIRSVLRDSGRDAGRGVEIPFANAADYQRTLSDVRLVSFPDLGHLPQEEDPAGSLPPVRDFLTASRSPAITNP